MSENVERSRRKRIVISNVKVFKISQEVQANVLEQKFVLRE